MSFGSNYSNLWLGKHWFNAENGICVSPRPTTEWCYFVRSSSSKWQKDPTIVEDSMPHISMPSRTRIEPPVINIFEIRVLFHLE